MKPKNYDEVKFIDGPRVGTSRIHYKGDPPYCVIPLPEPLASDYDKWIHGGTHMQTRSIRILTYELIVLEDDYGYDLKFYRLTADSKKEYLEFLQKRSDVKDYYDILENELQVFKGYK